MSLSSNQIPPEKVEEVDDPGRPFEKNGRWLHLFKLLMVELMVDLVQLVGC